MNGTLLGQTKGSDTIVFLYDEKGNKYGFDYNGTKYYYIFNVQGDVIGILNQSGSQIVSYQYDPWGKVLSVSGSEASTIGQINPIRYRGYYYDTETGFYYLQSLYYDPTTRRFLNVDSQLSGTAQVQGYNLFAYCLNNPIMMIDSTGNWPKWVDGVLTVLSGAGQVIAGAALGAAANWTGVGAVAGALLIANGLGTIWSGVAQFSNDVFHTSVLEENPIRTGARALGNAIGGTQGEKVGATVYDTANFAATVYSIVGGGATGLSKTVSSIQEVTSITKCNFSMLPKSQFMNTYEVKTAFSTIKYIKLPKPWFRAVNGVGAIIDATTTGKSIYENVLNIYPEESE